MTHAVISCLHANLAALEAVLADIDQRGITTITCLGDLVGYGPQPNEVVNLVRERAIPSCQGCWDEDIIEGLNSCECSYPSQLAERRGHQAHQWTAEQLSEEKDWAAINQNSGYRSFELNKNIKMFANTAGGFAVCSFVRQDFSQIPSPGAFALLGFAGAVAGRRRKA